MTPPPGRLDFSLQFGRQGAPPRRRQEPRAGTLLVAAPYSGLGARAANERGLAPRPLPVEDLAAGFRALSLSIALEPLTPGQPGAALRPEDPEDLHAEALLVRVPALAELWEPLRALDHDASAASRLTTALGRGAASVGRAAASPAGAEPPAAPSEEANAMLSRLLGGPAPAAGAGTSGPRRGPQSAVEDWVQRLVAATAAAPRAGSETEALRTLAEEELGRRLRALLRQEGFRSAAASWQATEALIRSCPDESLTRFAALDASWAELTSDPRRLARWLATDELVLLVVDHCFEPDPEQLAGLVSLARACAERSIELVTGATAALAGGPTFAVEPDLDGWPGRDLWQSGWSDDARRRWAELVELRASGAPLSLVVPRCLVRQPFGARGEPLDGFAFEELENPPAHESFAWASGAYLVARARMAQWSGAPAQLDGTFELSGLPVVTVADGDGLRMQPPVEAVLGMASVQRLVEQGFTVIQAGRNTDRARVHG